MVAFSWHVQFRRPFAKRHSFLLLLLRKSMLVDKPIYGIKPCLLLYLLGCYSPGHENTAMNTLRCLYQNFSFPGHGWSDLARVVMFADRFVQEGLTYLDCYCVLYSLTLLVFFN